MYRAPLKDLRFVLHELIGEAAVLACPAFADYSADTADAILAEGAKFAEEVLDPIQKSGDRDGARWTPDGVVMPAAYKDAYAKFIDGGWTTLNASPAHGGQGVPIVLATAIEELWAGSNLAFKLCPMLTQGAIEALETCATPAQKQQYLPKMVSGEWTGTMNLTEPQAGSDLGAIRTRAVPDGANFRLFGQKIFITYGDHDLTSNIVHMVLARIDGAPAGTKGISLFIVPKFRLNDDGSLGERNDVRCVSIEHKLGIHASPTCVLAYGDGPGALGHLIGEPNRGLEYMFVMMNAARLAVGLEGYAMAERAYQQAAEWARTRVQGKPSDAGGTGAAVSAPTIIGHPDVKRMLLTMKSNVEAMRALAIYAAHQLDLGGHHPDAATRAAAQSRGDLLIPIVKGWCTETGVELTSLGIQIHGGMGYIEETGAAQLWRDARITTIYEGTTGIQANDLIGRKLARDRGAAMASLLAEAGADLAAIRGADASLSSIAAPILDSVKVLAEATENLLLAMRSDPRRGLAVAVPYLKAAGIVLSGWMMAKSAAIAARRLAGASSDPDFYAAKLAGARFFAAHVTPFAAAHAATVKNGADSVLLADAALIV